MYYRKHTRRRKSSSSSSWPSSSWVALFFVWLAFHPVSQHGKAAGFIPSPYSRGATPLLFSSATPGSPTPPLRRKPSGPQDNLFARQDDASKKPTLPERSLFPLWRLIEIDPDRLPGVYQLTVEALSSPMSTGPMSYFIDRRDQSHLQGNVLIDPPEFSEGLARQLEELGGVPPSRLIYTNKKRVVGDPRQWKRRFPNMARVMHSFDVNNPNCTTMETKLQGQGPWQLDPLLEAIYTPGNTPGHICIRYSPYGNKSEIALFTGDHLGYSHSVGALSGYPQDNCFSIRIQGHAIGSLLNVTFSWLLPARGRRIWFWHEEHRRELISTTYWRFVRNAHEEKYDTYQVYGPRGSSPRQKSRQIRALPVDPQRLPGVLCFVSMDDVTRGNIMGYLLIRGEGEENIMVDCPPYDEELAAQLTIMGRPRLLIITHLDGGRGEEHQRWKEHFPDSCRMIHGFDMDPNTRFAEMVLQGGNQSWKIGDDIEMFFTPGRTAGHLSLLYRPKGGDSALFSGGMVGYNTETGHLDAFPQKNAHSLALQEESLRKVAGLDFNWLLPTGAGMHYFDDAGMTRTNTILGLASGLHLEYNRRTATSPTLEQTPIFRHLDPLKLPNVYEMGYEEDPTASRAYIFEVPDKERPLRVMIDTVPYTPELADEVAKAMGPHGINILFFTSARRLVDGEKWALRFPIMQCVIHALDTQDDAKARFIPLKLKGKGPWENFGGGITVVSTPGMTPGHISIFLRHFSGNRVLFSGDILVFSESDQRLDGRPAENRCSLLQQYMSIAGLARLPSFRWLLPAQGRALHFSTSEEAEEAINEAASYFYNTSSIHFLEAHRQAFIHTNVREESVHDEPYVRAVDEMKLPGVYELGYYEAHQGHQHPQAYLLRRGPDSDLNVMVDTPYYSTRLAEMVEALGGARLLLHTHRRPANADTEKWCKRLLGSVRMIHADDVDDFTRFAEMKLRGSNASWALNDDIMIVTTPGLTPGHVCLQYRPIKGEVALFTGGMLAYDPTLGQLAEPDADSPIHSLNRLKRSLSNMAQAARFQWVLPSGKGGVRFNDTHTGPSQIRAVVESLGRKESSQDIPSGEVNATAIPGVFLIGQGGYLVSATTSNDVWLLIDPPPYTEALANALGQRVGTHEARSRLLYTLYTDSTYLRLDADTSGWKSHFPGAVRVWHQGGSTPSDKEGGRDMALEGGGPWHLEGAHDVQVFHTPGPNPSCLSILVPRPRDQSVLFSGRTGGYSPELSHVHGYMDSQGVRAVSVMDQANSLRKLASKDFRWLASGLGHLHHFEDASDRALSLLDGADRLEK